MGPESMVAGGDSQTRVEVKEYGECCSLPVQRGEVSSDAAHKRDEEDEVGVQPVDVLVPVAPCYGILGDVGLLQIIVLGSQRLVLAGSIRDTVGCCNNGRRQASRGRRHGGRFRYVVVDNGSRSSRFVFCWTSALVGVGESMVWADEVKRNRKAKEGECSWWVGKDIYSKRHELEYIWERVDYTRLLVLPRSSLDHS